jgi:leucyl aminopeptidase
MAVKSISSPYWQIQFTGKKGNGTPQAGLIIGADPARRAYSNRLAIQDSPALALTDLFSPVAPNEARIVLTPLAVGKNPKGATPKTLTGLARLLNALASGEWKDDLGNWITHAKVPGKFKKKEDAEKAVITMARAFEDRLADLPQSTKTLTVVLPETLPEGVDTAVLVRELAQRSATYGINLKFHRQDAKNPVQLAQVLITRPRSAFGQFKDAIREGQVLGEAMNLTRHLVHSPANYKTTGQITREAMVLASPTLKVSALGKAQLQAEKMGLFLSVGQGNEDTAEKQPRLLEMVYQAKDYDPKKHPTVLLVGKGIIFDTGGNNLKASEYMHNMQGDMAGAAAVIGTLKALDAMQLSGVRVVGLGCLTENRISGKSTLMHDIYTARNGKTVEISNTDAEGRLVLADAIHYGMEKYKPTVVADMATLTGGKVRGLGEQDAVALSGNNTALMTAANKIERGLGNKTAVLELNDAHRKWVTKDGKGRADVFNSVDMEDALKWGVIKEKPDKGQSPTKEMYLQHSAQGAAFIREFLANPKTPWVHYDIAGAEFAAKDPKRGNEEFATGFGVKSLYFLTKKVAEGQIKSR